MVRLPVFTKPTQLWIVTGIVSAGERHWGTARLYAAPTDADRICGGPCATHAESPDADEPAASARHLGYYGMDRHEDPSSDCGRRAGSDAIGRPTRRAHESNVLPTLEAQILIYYCAAISLSASGRRDLGGNLHCPRVFITCLVEKG